MYVLVCYSAVQTVHQPLSNHRRGGGGHALENFDVHLCNLIGQLLSFNALRVCISIYGVQVLRGLSY